MPLSDPSAWPPGWHGKLPSLGDFAQRRMDADFLATWDTWLAEGLLAMRAQQPQDWLQAYLASPSWRFVLAPGAMPGVAGTRAWAGVLMPSVDRVGRYFPLTVVQPLNGGPGSAQEMTGLWQWLARVDDLARDALYEDWTAERLEDELARMARPQLSRLPPASAAPPGGPGALVEMQAPGGVDAALHIGAEAQRAWAERGRGLAWWHARPDDLPPRLLVSRGLPEAASLARLFGPAATI